LGLALYFWVARYLRSLSALPAPFSPSIAPVTTEEPKLSPSPVPVAVVPLSTGAVRPSDRRNGGN
jgi:hypothetical protein